MFPASLDSYSSSPADLGQGEGVPVADEAVSPAVEVEIREEDKTENPNLNNAECNDRKSSSNDSAEKEQNSLEKQNSDKKSHEVNGASIKSSNERTSSSASYNRPASSTSKPDEDWSITFEQFLASMLTEVPLVSFFEQIVDVTSSVEKLRNRQLLEKQQISPSSSPLTSQSSAVLHL